MILNSGKPTFEMTSEEVKTVQDFIWLLFAHFRVEDNNLYRLIHDFPRKYELEKKPQILEGEFYDIKIKENK